jgi:hypothetical protein
MKRSLRNRSENKQSTEEAVWRPASSRKSPRAAEETDPGQWQVLEEVGWRLERDGLPCETHGVRDAVIQDRR